MFCTQCGKENLNDAKFCGGCGTTINSNIAIPASNAINSESTNTDGFYLSETFINSKSFDELIGNNSSYYKAKFLSLSSSMKKLITYGNLPISERINKAGGNLERQRQIMSAAGFNFWAFIFQCGWLAYRRMYGYATAWLLTMLLGEYIAFREKVTVAMIGYIIVVISFGFFANSTYFQYLNQLLKKNKITDYAEAGGVSIFGFIIFFVAYLILSAAISSTY